MTSCQFFIKYFRLASFTLLIVSAVNAQTESPAKPFEGVLQLQVQDWQSVEMVNYYVKGDRARMESLPNTSAEPYYIIDYSVKKMFMILTDRDAYFVISMEKPSGGQANTAPAPEPMTKTEETQTILGFPCEQWVLSENDLTTTIWATKALNATVSLVALQKQNMRASSRWDEELQSRGLFPLKLTQQDSNGTDVYKFEVRKIQRKPVSETLLRIPEGYEQTDKPIINKPIKK